MGRGTKRGQTARANFAQMPTGGRMPNKPEPLFIDGHYHYTLSSYDPVEATMPAMP